MKKKERGMGFFSTLTLIFFALKLVGLISWAWIAVLSPLLIAVAFNLLVLLINACQIMYDWRVRK